MRLRIGIALFSLVVFGVALRVVAGRSGRDAENEPAFDAAHPVWHWQGPFTYVREFGSNAPGCAFHGFERVKATLECAGTDLHKLQCWAHGTAEHTYREDVEGNGVKSDRTDTGSYQGALRADYLTRNWRGSNLFDVSVGTPVAIRYRQASGAQTTQSGSYTLRVAGSTDEREFDPQSARIDYRRTERIYEPGPAACDVSGPFNGKSEIAVRLLPAD